MVLPGGERTLGLHLIEPVGHRHGQVLAADTARGRPHPLQHAQRVVGVPTRLGPAPVDHGDRRARAALGLRQPAAQLLTRVVTVPARHLDHLVQDPALVLTRGPSIRECVLLRDLNPSRQPLPIHTPDRGPPRPATLPGTLI